MYKYACVCVCMRVVYTYDVHIHARASTFPVFSIYNFRIKYSYKLGARLSRVGRKWEYLHGKAGQTAGRGKKNIEKGKRIYGRT